MGSHNSVGWMFSLRGVTRLPLPGGSDRLETLELTLIDAGADDVREEDGRLVVISATDRLESIRAALNGTPAVEADVEYVPTTTTTIARAAQTKLYDLLEALDELDDVTRVTCNET